MPSAGSFLRQLSGKEGWKSTSKRWSNGNTSSRYSNDGMMSCEKSWKQMDGMGMYGYNDGHDENGNGGMMMTKKKRVMVVVDQSSRCKHAMMWALTHVTNKGDLLTLLHIISPCSSSSESPSPYLASSLGSLCKACKPEVEVEAVMIQGPKLATVLSQVKKLEVSVLVLGQKKPSPVMNCLFGVGSTEDIVEQCINSAECLTIGVKKQSKGMNGYLISTRWQKNFWLLA